MEKKIIEFLRMHKLISIYGLEKKLSFPEGTIAKAVKGTRGLPNKYHDAIIFELKKYGFTEFIPD